MDRFLDSLPEYLNNRFVAAAAMVVAALVVAWIVDFFVTRVLRTVTRRTESRFDDRLVQILHNPVRTTVLLVGLVAAIRHLEFPNAPTALVVAALKTSGLVVWTVFAVRFVGLAIRDMAGSDRISWLVPRTAPLFENIARILLVGIAIYFVFLFWGIEVTAWLASAGVVGIAVGFAAKDTLANLFSGIFILADAPYNVGDTINLDSGDRGVVTHIGLRSTRLLTTDDVEVTLPNAIIANAKIVNESGGPYTKHRIRIAVGVAYGSDVEKVTDILTAIGEASPRTCDEPSPRARFRLFGDSSLDFELLCWIDDPLTRGVTIHELNIAIYKKFEEEGVRIPFPQRDLWIKESPRRED